VSIILGQEHLLFSLCVVLSLFLIRSQFILQKHQGSSHILKHRCFADILTKYWLWIIKCLEQFQILKCLLILRNICHLPRVHYIIQERWYPSFPASGLLVLFVYFCLPNLMYCSAVAVLHNDVCSMAQKLSWTDMLEKFCLLRNIPISDLSKALKFLHLNLKGLILYRNWNYCLLTW